LGGGIVLFVEEVKREQQLVAVVGYSADAAIYLITVL
jgi:hypothetical protein